MVLAINAEKVAGSTNCTIGYTVDTEDVTSKDDENFLFTNIEPNATDWNIQNESFIASEEDALRLIQMWLSAEKVPVTAQDPNGRVTLNGYAFITSLELQAPVDGYATLNLSLEGTGSDLLDE